VIFVLLCVRKDTKILKKEVLIYNFYKKITIFVIEY
jgi:hypothetical protein